MYYFDALNEIRAAREEKNAKPRNEDVTCVYNPYTDTYTYYRN